MGGDKRVYQRIEADGRRVDIKPTEINKPLPPPTERKLPPLDLASLADDDGSEPTQIMHRVHVDEVKSIRLNPEEAAALIRQAEAKRDGMSSIDPLDAKVVSQQQAAKTIMGTEVVGRRAPDHLPPSARDSHNKTVQVRAPKPSLGARIKGWFTSAS